MRKLFRRTLPEAPDILFAEKTMFLGLGPTKTGTTWLYNYLLRHPEFYGSPVKETHYFSARHHCRNRGIHKRHLTRQIERIAGNQEYADQPHWREYLSQLREALRMSEGAGRYRRFYKTRAKPAHRAFGEISPSYCALTPDGFAAIRAHHPRIRLLLTLRDPLARLDSVLRHIRGLGNKVDYELFFDRGLARRLEVHNFRYDTIVETIESVVDPEEFSIVFFEDLFEQRTVDAISDFIGIARRPADFGTQFAHSPAVQHMNREQRERAEEVLSPVYAYCRDRFGDALPERWAS
ncbi:sulfotransferase [Parasphingopyxis algicola]|uniref:sulfotransferase n=1 Tax=Parasphingopyxis algicola TaxID=2026624 RepID=UPI0015A078F1|nr:sulfotransferase [Parasphingopyxis algicola]QLC25018.1 sulfotransferase [Parasphingopyxis algicola]